MNLPPDPLIAAPPLVLIGGANLDIVAHTDMPLLPSDSNPGHVHCAAGGVARNVAHNLARLGLQPALVSVLGQDAFGDTVLAATRDAGVDTRHCSRLPGAHTATYLSLHGPDGDMAVAVNDMDILARLDGALLAPLAPTLAAARCLVLDSNLYPEALEFLLGGRFQAPVLVDAVSATKCLRLLPWLPAIHTLQANRLEAGVLTGMVVDSPAAARTAAQALHAKGVRDVVVTLGAQGVAWCDATGASGYRCAPALAVVNTSGAGDALLAGLVYGHLAGWPLERALAWAMACAEITLQSPDANAANLSAAAVQARVASSASRPSL